MPEDGVGAWCRVPFASLSPAKECKRSAAPRDAERLIYLDQVVGRGIDLFRAVCELDLEGIVAKRRDGAYDADATTWWRPLGAVRQPAHSGRRTSMTDARKRLRGVLRD